MSNLFKPTDLYLIQIIRRILSQHIGGNSMKIRESNMSGAYDHLFKLLIIGDSGEWARLLPNILIMKLYAFFMYLCFHPLFLSCYRIWCFFCCSPLFSFPLLHRIGFDSFTICHHCIPDGVFRYFCVCVCSMSIDS